MTRVSDWWSWEGKLNIIALVLQKCQIYMCTQCIHTGGLSVHRDITGGLSVHTDITGGLFVN